MFIVITICGLLIVLAYEIRHRMVTLQLNYLDKEMQRLDQEIKKLRLLVDTAKQIWG